MELNKGISKDGHPTNKDHGTWEHAKNVLLGDDYRSAKSTLAFDELYDIIGHGTYTIVGDISLDDRLLIFVVDNSGFTKSILYNYDIKTNTKTIVFSSSKFIWRKENPIEAIYTYDDDNQLIVAWCDGITDNSNRPMIINVDAPAFTLDEYYDVVDITDLYLFNNFEYIGINPSVGTGGSFKTGNYFVTSRYKLSDNSYTNWNPIGNSISIGSKPDEHNDNTIIVSLSSLNSKYKLLDIALVSYINGIYSSVLYDDIAFNGTSISKTLFQLSDEVIDYNELLVNDVVYKKINSIKLTNKRIYAGAVTNFNDEINYQKYANDIVPSYKKVVAGTTQQTTNHPSFAHGEIVSFNIHFIEKYTGNITKGFHIPGRTKFSDLGFNEATTCRDVTDANYYHTFVAEHQLTNYAGEQIPREYIKIPNAYRSMTAISLRIFADGTEVHWLTFTDVIDYETYLNSGVTQGDYIVGYLDKYIRIQDNTSTSSSNHKLITIAVSGVFEGDIINVESDMPDYVNNVFELHGGFDGTILPMQYWENKNEEYPEDNELFFPTGKVRHHRFPDLASMGITNYTNLDLSTAKLYPNFENIYIPQHIADQIDGYIISYIKKDSSNRTSWGLANVNSFTGGGSSNDTSSRPLNYFGPPTIMYIYKGVNYAESLSNGTGKKDNLIKLKNLELLDNKIDPDITHIVNMGYIDSNMVRHFGNTDLGEYQLIPLRHKDWGEHPSDAGDVNGLLNHLLVTDPQLKLSTVDSNKLVYALKGARYMPNNSIAELDFGSDREKVSTELVDGAIVAKVDANAYYGGNAYYDINNPATIGYLNTNRMSLIERTSEDGNQYMKYQEPVVALIKQISDVNSLDSNKKLIYGLGKQITSAGIYDTNSDYLEGDVYVNSETYVFDAAYTMWQLTGTEDYLTQYLAAYAEDNIVRFEFISEDGDFNRTTSPFTFIKNLVPAIATTDTKNHTYSETNNLKSNIIPTDTNIEVYIGADLNLPDIYRGSGNTIYSNFSYQTFDYTQSFLALYNAQLRKHNEIILSGIKTYMSGFNKILPNLVIWSDVINSIGSNAYNLKQFKANNQYYMPIENGTIIKLFGVLNNLFIQQTHKLSVSAVKDVIQTDEATTYLGSGDIFDRLPLEIISTDGDDIRCNVHNHIIKTPYGFVVIDIINKKIFMVTTEGAQNLTAAGADKFFRDILAFDVDETITPTDGHGVMPSFDEENKMLYLTILNSENHNDVTIGYHLMLNRWFTFDTWIPDYVLSLNNALYSTKLGYLYKHNSKESHILQYYRTLRSNAVRAVHNSFIDVIFSINPNDSKIYEAVFFETKAKDANGYDLYDKTIDKIMLYNDNQCTGLIDVSEYHGDTDWYIVDKRDVDHRWSFNKLRDAVIDAKAKILDSDTKDVYTPNVNANGKDWYDLSEIIGNYVIIRLLLNNDTNNKVTLNKLSVSARKYNR